MTVSIDIASQPDDRTCGATCLHALYRHHGSPVQIDTLSEDVPQLPDGGTLGVHLASHALARGLDATIFTYNLQLFDPTWFAEGVDLAERLEAQAQHKDDERLQSATHAYLRFLELGGNVQFTELDERLVARLVERGPLLVGLSATYLYRSMREIAELDEEDDLRGEPVGHFVLVEGYEPAARRVRIADPWADNPMTDGQHYAISYDRLVASILLSIVTFDANLVAITKKAS